jgi:aspartyl protease family protein
MKKNIFNFLLFFVSLFLTSCNSCSEQSDTSWAEAGDGYYSDYSELEYEQNSDNILDDTAPEEVLLDAGSIDIPYTEQYGNTITIPVKINGMGLDMIFDTGASTTCITLAEAEYLYQKGALPEEDIIDEQMFQTADGSISVGLRINLMEVQIGDKITLYNIEALVVENQQAPLLLGQSVMKQFREISVDRENEVVKFFFLNKFYEFQFLHIRHA